MKKIILMSRKKSASVVSQVYSFDASATSYMDTDFNLNGLDHQSVVVRARITDLGAYPQMTFIGTNHTTRFFLQYVPLNDRLYSRLIQSTESALITDIGLWTADTLWHQFAFTYDGTNMAIYEDGVLIQTVADPDFNGFSESRPVEIGMSAHDTTRGLIGEISDYQHYNKGLSLAELQALNTDITDTATGLVANFAGNKVLNTWTDEVSGYEATNGGGVTLIDE